VAIPVTLSLKGRALRYLAARELSRAEIERKLAPHTDDPGELARVLDELQAKGFISEQRVVESVLHRRAARQGASRIRQELLAKGIDPALTQQAVADLQASENARAQAVWLKKFGEAATDAPGRARQARFLASRGFRMDVIVRVIRGDLELEGGGFEPDD